MGFELACQVSSFTKKEEEELVVRRLGDRQLEPQRIKECASKEIPSNDSSLCVLRVGSEEETRAKQLDEASHVRASRYF